jgi:hypothetical protein
MVHHYYLFSVLLKLTLSAIYIDSSCPQMRYVNEQVSCDEIIIFLKAV